MKTSRPFHFHSWGSPACNCLGGSLRQGAQHVGGEAAAGVAVAGGVGRADLRPDGRPVGDDPGHGVAAAVVVAEHLAEEAPDGRDRAEHPVAILDAVFVEDVEDAGFGQDVGEREPWLRGSGANRLQAGHGMAFSVRRWDRSGGRHPLVGRGDQPPCVYCSPEQSPRWPPVWKIRRRGQAGHRAVARAASA